MAHLERIVKGEPRTLIEAVEANKIIDLLNAIAKMKVSPNGAGKFVAEEGGAVLDLSPMAKVIADEVKKQFGTDLKEIIREVVREELHKLSITAACLPDRHIQVGLVYS